MTRVTLRPGPVVLDVAGTVLEPDEKIRLSHPLVGGVILFTRNYGSRAQLQALCAAIHSERPDILIAVDQEGGRVQRFRAGFTEVPAMSTLGALWAQSPGEACAMALQAGETLGRELAAVGIDMNYAPVLDLDYGRSAVVGTRAFDANPHVVATLARCVITGLTQAGVAHCGKHFPGHGWVLADSHLALPTDERALDQLWVSDLQPYLHLLPELRAVMPAHVLYPQVDPLHTAGFSPVWLQEILRRRMCFNGLIFSDDLTMEAAGVAGGIVGRARAALAAGCDMILVCNKPELADEVLGDREVAEQAQAGAESRYRRLDALLAGTARRAN